MRNAWYYTELAGRRVAHYLAGWLPRRLCYYALLRVVTHCTTGPYRRDDPRTVTLADALDRLDHWA